MVKAVSGWEFNNVAGFRYSYWMSMITTMEPFRDRVNGATSGSG